MEIWILLEHSTLIGKLLSSSHCSVVSMGANCLSIGTSAMSMGNVNDVC